MDERRTEVVVSGPLVIESKGSGRQAHDGRKRRVSKTRKKTSKVKEEEDNSNDQRPDLRDFIERVIGVLVIESFLVYCCWIPFLPVRSMFMFILLGLAFYVGILIVGRRVYLNSEKRIRKGKRYKFMDVDNGSEWIYWLTKLGMIGAMFLLAWLWATNNLKHYWCLTVLVPVLMSICLIFTPKSADPDVGGIDF